MQRALSPFQRQVFLLRHQGVSLKQTAEQLHTTITDVEQVETDAVRSIETSVLQPRGFEHLPENLAKLDVDFIRESGYIPTSFLERKQVDALLQTYPHLRLFERKGVLYIHHALLYRGTNSYEPGVSLLA